MELLHSDVTDVTESKVHLTPYMTVTRNDNFLVKRHFKLHDRLGSTTLVVKQNGEKIKAMSYDPFGKPRDGDDWKPLSRPELNFRDSLLSSDITKRGFTEHEHLDNFELIHMNGRMFDFNNGRFLSVDPFIQGTDSQAINPYSYIQNNPLAGVDPTGYLIHLFDDGRCGITDNRCGKSVHPVNSGDYWKEYASMDNGANRFTMLGKKARNISDTESQQNVTSMLPSEVSVKLVREANPGAKGDISKKIKKLLTVSTDPINGDTVISGNINFYFYGDENDEVIENFMKEVEDINTSESENGVTIRTEISFTRVEKKREADIRVKIDNNSRKPDSANWRRRRVNMYTYKNNDAKSAAHEVLHILGLNDAYDEYRKMWVPTYPEWRYTPPHPGYENSIMANSRLSPSFQDLSDLVSVFGGEK